MSSAGRFDRQIAVNLPSSKSRSAILSLYAQKSCLSADVNLDDLAKRTTGFSGADLANLIMRSQLS